MSEFTDRCHHFYRQTNGEFDWPNSAEGDLLKIGHREMSALQDRMTQYELYLEERPHKMSIWRAVVSENDKLRARVTELEKVIKDHLDLDLGHPNTDSALYKAVYRRR